jgi:hypothetical protein
MKESKPSENSIINMNSKPRKYEYKDIPPPQQFIDLVNKVESGLADGAEIFDLAFQYQLGLSGTNFAPNKLKAAELYKLAAERGEILGHFLLALCLRDGVGVPRDYVECVKRICLGAEEGECNAQYMLGILYLPEHRLKFTGLLSSDLTEAYAWVNLAVMNIEVDRHSFMESNTLTDIESKLSNEQILAAQKRSREILSQIETRKKAKRNQG